MKGIFLKRAPTSVLAGDTALIKLSNHFPLPLRKFLCGQQWVAFVDHLGRGSYSSASQELNDKSINDALSGLDQKRQIRPKPYWVATLILGVYLGSTISPAFFLLFAAIAYLQNHAAKTACMINIQYLLNPDIILRYTKFCKSFESLKLSHMVWVQPASAEEGESREVAQIGYGLPSGLIANTRFPCLKTNSYSVYFTPDAIIIQTGKRTQAKDYSAFTIQESSTAVHETLFSLKDALEVGKRHEFTTVSGQPDKRRKQNRQLPINQYPVLDLRGAGMNFNIIASNPRGFSQLCSTELIKLMDSCNPTQRAANPEPANKIIARDLEKQKDKPLPKKDVTPKDEDDLLTAVNMQVVVSLGGRSTEHYNLSTDTTYAIPSPESFNEDAVIESGNCWVPQGQAIKIHGIEISGGMFYYSPRASSIVHPNLIQGNLSVSRDDENYRRELGGYWPNYHMISPGDRRAYLNFLASDRSDKSTGIGFVFLYFYGLERQLILQAIKPSLLDEEIISLINEVKRLVEVFGFNNSVKRYGKNLIEFAERASDLDDDFHSKIFEEALPKLGTGSVNSKVPKLSVNIAIAKHVACGGHIDVDWAYLWAQQFSDSLDKTVVSYKPLFYKAFVAAYNRRYQDGFPILPTNAQISTGYHPASNGISYFEYKISDLHDIAGSHGNSKRILELINDVHVLTEPYWRIKRKSGSSAFTLEPYLYLSADLWPPKATEITAKFLKKSGKPMTIGDLATSFTLTTVNRQSLTRIYSRLAEQGIYIEPNILQGMPTPKVVDPIIVFTHEPGEHLKPTSDVFLGATIYVELACGVSVADGTASDSEKNQMLHRIDAWVGLSEFEKKCLVAKVTLLLAQSVSFTKLKGRLKLLPAHEVDHIAELLVRVSTADNKIDPQEVSLLEKIFAALGISDKLHDYIHSSLTHTKQAAPVVATEAPINDKSGSLPASATVSAGISLDFAKIAQLQAETRHVASILSDVFDQDAEEIADASPQAAGNEPVQNGIDFAAFPDLNVKQSKFLQVLLSQGEWSRADLMGEATRLGIMLDGTLEVLNEMSWDVFDEALTDGDAIIEVDQNIAGELQATN